MSERSLSPSNRVIKNNESGLFRQRKEYDEDFIGDNLSESENEEKISETSESDFCSESMFQSPDKSFSNKVSPHGSPSLVRRKNFENNDKSFTQEKHIEEFTRKYLLNNSRSECFGNSPRKSSLTKSDVKNLNIELENIDSHDYRPTLSMNCTHTMIIKQLFTSESADKSSLPVGKILGIGLLLLAIVLIVGIFFVNHSPKKVEIDRAEKMFMADWVELKAGFKSQMERFWSITGSATKSVIFQTNPRDPAVILLAIPKSSTLTLVCFLRKYITTVNGFFGDKDTDVIKFNSQVYRDLKPDRVKMKIDQKLEEGFKSGCKVAIIEHLESLKAEAAMMFHKFCDNDIAPYKRVTIIFTLYLSDEEFLSSEESDRFVEEKLARLWEPVIGVDNFRPLMSRIANNVVFLRPENPDDLIENGC